MTNSSDITILRSFVDSRDSYEKYSPYIMALKNMERTTRTFLGFVKSFYDKYPSVNQVTETQLRTYLDQNDVTNFAKNNEQFFKSVFTFDMSNKDLAMDTIEAGCERHFMSQVVDKASLVLNNNKAGVLSSIQDIIDEYHGLIRRPPTDYKEYILDLDELIKKEITNTGIPFVNQTPNDLIRGMREGQLGLIYAYTDTGKTSYGVANLCAAAKYMFDNQYDRPAVYATNEEAVDRVTLRAIQCMTNWDDSQIERYKSQVKSIINKRGFSHMRFVDEIYTMTSVQKVLAKMQPRVLFIDQGTKVNLPGSRREGVNALEEVFNNYRSLAKKFDCTIICMAQGGEECADKQYPSLKNLYGSKSAIQGELDWAIALGTTTDAGYEGWRYFNITKNKGDKGTYACRFDTKKCQFKEVTT